MTDLRWTKTRPTEVGLYWSRQPNRPPEITDVTRGPEGDLWIDGGLWALDELSPDTEWAGPLPKPQEGPGA